MARMRRFKYAARCVFFSWPPFFMALIAIWIFSQTQTAAALYGAINPVVTPLQITHVAPAIVNGAPGSRISGIATIKRDTCDYLDIEWTLHGDRRSVRATAFFSDPAEVREGGQQRWEALLVGVPPHMLDQTTGDVHHQCGVFPVTSPFFRPDTGVIPEEAGATARCSSGAYSTSTGKGTCSGQGGVEEWLD